MQKSDTFPRQVYCRLPRLGRSPCSLLRSHRLDIPSIHIWSNRGFRNFFSNNSQRPRWHLQSCISRWSPRRRIHDLRLLEVLLNHSWYISSFQWFSFTNPNRIFKFVATKPLISGQYMKPHSRFETNVSGSCFHAYINIQSSIMMLRFLYTKYWKSHTVNFTFSDVYWTFHIPDTLPKRLLYL